MAIKLDFEKDDTIDIDNLKEEFRRIGPLIRRYVEIWAEAGEAFGIAKAAHEELRSKKYLQFRSQEGKITEKTLEAMIDTDPDVIKAQRAMLEAERENKTIRGYVDGLLAKKDSLIQLGADARKEYS